MGMKGLDSSVLIDTSVWIDYFRKKENVYQRVNELIDAGRVCCLKMIIAELIQGCKSEKEIQIMRDLAHVLPLLAESPDSWEKAGILSFQLRKAGKRIGLGDCYIATVAKENDATIYTFDRHFKEIQGCEDIALL